MAPLWRQPQTGQGTEHAGAPSPGAVKYPADAAHWAGVRYFERGERAISSRSGPFGVDQKTAFRVHTGYGNRLYLGIQFEAAEMRNSSRQ